MNKWTGEILWQTSLTREYFDTMHGTHSTGVLVGDYWYLPTGHASGSDDANWMSTSFEFPWHPNVVVLEKETGKLVAQDDVVVGPHQHGAWCALSTGVVDGRQLVFWGDAFGYVHAFHAQEEFNAEDGLDTLERVWQCDANPRSYRYMDSGGRMPYAFMTPGPKDIGPCEIVGTPVFHEGLLYVTLARDVAYSRKEGKRKIGNGGLVCIDPRGEGDITETNKVWTNTDLNRTFATPSVLDDIIIAGDHAGYVLGMDRETGETLWKGDIEAPVWNFWQVVGDGKVYCMNELRGFYIFSVEDGELLYSAQMDGQNNPPPGIAHGRLIVGTSRSIDCYAGPEYLKLHKPDEVVESDQIRTGAALDEPLEHDGH
jgi:hypothetical protein